MIKDGAKVTIAFELKDEQGTVWDSATKDEPFSYTHGQKQLMQVVEQALAGKAQGEKVSIAIPPSQAYGEVDERLQKAMPREQFADMPNLKEGMSFSLSEDAHMTFKIIKIDENHVWLDGNHPLAGKTLTFAIDILKVEL